MSSARHHSAIHAVRSTAQRRTVLLTGASGVLGRALLPYLHAAEIDVVALVHRTSVVGPHVSVVSGDLTEPRLGLSPAVFAALASRVDAVLHSAAVTNFGQRDEVIQATNVAGTRRVLDFAAQADVPVYHVSTSYLHATSNGDRGQTAVRYATSKRAAEALVHDSGLDHVMLRPSVITGDSTSGVVASFQGLYRACGALFAGLLPMVPFDPNWSLDFVPQDVVASAIATVVARGLRHGEFWITAGPRALTLGETVEQVRAAGLELGLDVPAPTFVAPEVFDRLIAPVFLEALPVRMRTTVLRLLEFFTVYVQGTDYQPSSLPELVRLGAAPLPDQRSSLRAAVRYWAATSGLVLPVASEAEVA